MALRSIPAHVRYPGIIPAVTTPFGADGELDIGSLEANVREMVAFYGQVADDGGLPIMAYNNPAASGVDLAAETLAQIAREVPGLVAVKECSGDTRRIPALLAATDLEVLVGGDDWALEGFAGGATGWVSGVANVAPRECAALWERLQDGDLAHAREIYARILPLGRLDMTPKLVQFFKAADRKSVV